MNRINARSIFGGSLTFNPRLPDVLLSRPAFQILRVAHKGKVSSNEIQTNLSKKQSAVSENLILLEENKLITKNVPLKQKNFIYEISKDGVFEKYTEWLIDHSRAENAFELNVGWFKSDFLHAFDELIQDNKIHNLWMLFLAFTHGYNFHLFLLQEKKAKLENLNEVREAIIGASGLEEPFPTSSALI